MDPNAIPEIRQLRCCSFRYVPTEYVEIFGRWCFNFPSFSVRIVSGSSRSLSTGMQYTPPPSSSNINWFLRPKCNPPFSYKNRSYNCWLSLHSLFDDAIHMSALTLRFAFLPNTSSLFSTDPLPLKCNSNWIDPIPLSRDGRDLGRHTSLLHLILEFDWVGNGISNHFDWTLHRSW